MWTGRRSRAALPRCSCSQRAFPTWCGHSAWQRSARLCQPDRRTDNDAHSASSTREAEDVTNAAVREQEDQYHDLYVKEVTFHGGPRLVLHGLTDHSAHTTQIILGAIFGPRSERLPEQYVQQAGRLTRLVLSLSNVICTAAGLRRGVAATELERRDLLVPGLESLVELCAIVTFTQAELAHVLAGHPEGAGQPRRLLPAGGPDRGGDHHRGKGGRLVGADPGAGAPGHPDRAGQPRRLLPAGGPDRGGDHHLGEGGRRPGADPGAGAPGHPEGAGQPRRLLLAGGPDRGGDHHRGEGGRRVGADPGAGAPGHPEGAGQPRRLLDRKSVV